MGIFLIIGFENNGNNKMKAYLCICQRHRGLIFDFCLIIGANNNKIFKQQLNQSDKKENQVTKLLYLQSPDQIVMIVLLQGNIIFGLINITSLLQCQLILLKNQKQPNILYVNLNYQLYYINYCILFLNHLFQHHSLMDNLTTITPNSVNHLHALPYPSQNKKQSFRRGQEIRSQKWINEQESSIQLMIRAHERIRSLEQDNQILRKHVELLTRDNRQLIEKLVKVEDEKSETDKVSQQLKLRVRQLQIKLNQHQVRQGLEKLQKQNKYPLIQAEKPQLNHSISRIRQLSTTVPDPNIKIPNQVINSTPINIPHQHSQQNQIFYSPLNTVFKQKCYSLPHHQSYFKNYLQLQSQLPINNNQSCIVVKPDHGHVSSILDPLQHSYFKRSSSQDKPINNMDSYKYTSYLNNQTKKLSQKNDHPLTQLIAGRYSYKNGQVGTKSPLIRKNSPGRNKPSCEFHSKTQGTPGTFMGESTSESRLVKKYNYTNWRKVNNNLAVWKYANGNQNRPIIIQR